MNPYSQLRRPSALDPKDAHNFIEQLLRLYLLTSPVTDQTDTEKTVEVTPHGAS